MLSEKKIKDLVEENRDYLEALAEFNRTGKLRKIRTKERVNFTIDGFVMHEFRSYAQKHGQKMSTIIEKLIKKEINVKS